MGESEDFVSLRAYMEKIIELRFESAQNALKESQRTMDHRLEAMNQFREQILKERISFFSREAHETFARGLEATIQQLEDRIRVLEEKSSAMQGRVMMAGAVISAAIVISGIIIGIFLRLK